MGNARADNTHDGRYTHEMDRATPLDTKYPKVLYGKPGPKGTDTLTVRSQAAEEEAVKSGSWKSSPADWAKSESGQSRLGLLVAIVVAFALSVIGGPILMGQTAINTTTLAVALPAPTQGNQQQTIRLTSGSTVAVGQGIYVDREYMTVTASQPSSTALWTVKRGDQGTASASHNILAVALTGSPSLFGTSTGADPAGGCVSTSLTAQPLVNIGSGNILYCPPISSLAGSAAATWDLLTRGGLPASSATRLGYTYTSAGAVVKQSGVSFVGSSGALSMTITDPLRWMDGMYMTVEASTAQAHTLTYTTTGFNGQGSAADVCTFGGAIGDNIRFFARAGIWWVLSTRNCTLG